MIAFSVIDLATLALSIAEDIGMLQPNLNRVASRKLAGFSANLGEVGTVCLFVPFCLSVSVCLSVRPFCLSVCLSACQFICLYVCLFVCPSYVVPNLLPPHLHVAAWENNS